MLVKCLKRSFLLVIYKLYTKTAGSSQPQVNCLYDSYLKLPSSAPCNNVSLMKNPPYFRIWSCLLCCILGDSIYRQKYEKLKREMDFMKKKLEQQHEEELERKDAIKKQLERKVMFLPNELLQYAGLKRSTFNKHMCMCVFQQLFFSRNIQKVLFSAFLAKLWKDVLFFSVEPPIFQENTPIPMIPF